MISIIVPAYNVDKFLARCLDSILNQDGFDAYKDNVEIVIINDGSSDQTENIALHYCEKHSFIKLYSQENGGLSAARNLGLQKSTGEYIWFVDSDDWIAKDSLNVLFHEISSDDVDIIEFDVVYAIDYKNEFLFKKDNFYSSIETEVVFAKYFLELQGYIVSVTSKLIKKSIFINQNIQFPLNRFSEDNIVVLKLMLAANKYKKIRKALYFYYQREESITKNKNLDHVRKYLKDQILNLKDIDNEILNYNFKTTKIKEMQAFVVSNMIMSLLKNKFYLQEVNGFLDDLEAINQYPVKAYSYYNQGVKRELFRRVFNNRFLITLYKILN